MEFPVNGPPRRDFARPKVIYLNAATGHARDLYKMWKPISNAPTGIDLELAVIDADGTHALVVPCQRISGGWMNALNKERLDVRPTHWREWRLGETRLKAISAG